MRFVAWIPAGLITALTVGTSIDTLAEAYGAGPPYYSMTTHMDTWESPWPIVIMLGLACAGTIALTRWAIGVTTVPRV